MNTYEKIEKAIKFLSSYMGTMEELGKPTLLHSINVGLDLLNNGYKEHIIIAGFLHDIIEDTKTKNEMIKKEFGNDVLQLVLANTKNNNICEKERDNELLMRCLAFGKDAMAIKSSDIFENWKYFSKTDDSKRIARINMLGELFISILPSDFDDIVFERLRKIFKKKK